MGENPEENLERTIIRTSQIGIKGHQSLEYTFGGHPDLKAR